MKKLLLALTIFTSLSVFGQGRDLKVTLIKPTANDKIVSGQTFDIEYIIANNGTVPTNTTDSMIIAYFMNGVQLPAISGQNYAIYSNRVLNANDTIWRKFKLNLTYSGVTGAGQFCLKLYAQTGAKSIDSVQSNNVSCAAIFLPVNEVTKALESLEVYPNPASTVLNITLDYKLAKQITVMDLSGRIIEQVNMLDKNTEINVSSYNTGIYLYQISDVEGAVIKSGKFNVSR